MWELGITHSKPMDTKVLQHLDNQQSHTGVYPLTVWWGKRHQLGTGKMTVCEHQCLLRTGDTGESRLPNPGFALHPSPAWRKLKLPGDSSLMTYRGHGVLHTLIRCRFSPTHSTGQQFIYSGCSTGKVVGKDCQTREPQEGQERCPGILPVTTSEHLKKSSESYNESSFSLKRGG